MFHNENTFINMSRRNETEEFHKKYESALEQVRNYFGKEYPNIIGSDVKEQEKITDISPIDASSLASFQLASADSISKAIELLHSGFRSWYDTGYVERSRIMLACADALSGRKFEFGALLAYEHGKNRMEAMGDVDEAIDFIRYYALNMVENRGFDNFTGKAYENEESRSIMKPYGVFAVIAPFNFFSITVGMAVGPLTVGNAVLLKPSSDIPLASYLFVKLLHENGVPTNAVAYVSGSGSKIGRAVYGDSRVSGVVFTGSRSVGMDIYHNASRDSPKVIVTEMGGKDAIIVSGSADIRKAAEGVARSAFGYAGQKCSACSVVLVQEGVYDKFKEALLEFSGRFKPDDPRKRETLLNPVINNEAFQKYKSLTERLPAEGKILYGGTALERPGFYVEPTIISDVKWESFVIQEEHFLPILAMVKYGKLEDAVKLVNSLDYGLTGGIFTEDPLEINYYFNHAEVGVIYANRKSGGSTGAMVGSQPFVGWKMSGSTGKGTGSFYYLQQFLREQSQTIAH